MHDSNRKDKTNKPRAEQSLCIEIENVNVLIVFMLFLMQRKVSKGKEKSHCNIEICTYCYIFNALDKEMRRKESESHGCSLQIPCGIQTVM